MHISIKSRRRKCNNETKSDLQISVIGGLGRKEDDQRTDDGLCSVCMLSTEFIVYRRSSQNYEKRQLASSCPLFCPYVPVVQLGSQWTDLLEIWYQIFSYENLWRKFNFHSNPTRII
jgi:hypothetical protein